MKGKRLGRRVDVRKLNQHLRDEHSVRLAGEVDVGRLLVELCDDVKVLLQVRRQDVLQHQVAATP